MSLEKENFDRLLRRAHWPAASEESTRRLEEFWDREWEARESRRMWIWPVAAAATIAIGIGAAILLILNPPRMMPPIVSINPTPKVVKAPVKVAVLEGRP